MLGTSARPQYPPFGNVLCSNALLISRCLFLPVHAEAEAALAHHEAQHHLPDVRLPPGLRRLVLPQRGDLLHRQDRPVHSLQLRVSISEVLH